MYQVEGIVIIESIDYVLTPIYFFLIMALAFIIRNSTVHDSAMKKYFIPGLLVKIIGGLALGLIYAFYYKGGDTFYYFYDSKAFNLALNDGLDQFWRLLTLSAGEQTIYTTQYTSWICYFRDHSGWMADKVYGIISIFTLHSYWSMTIVSAALSFSGAWALYRTFHNLYPHLTDQLAFCVLFVPSVFFWGSGILKDSITFGCLGWITYCSYQIFFRQKRIFGNLILLLAVSYIALKVKAYIVISFLPALLFWIFLTYRSRIQLQFVRVISGPAVFMMSMVFGYLLIDRLGQEFSQFSLQNVVSTSQNYQLWHSYLAETSHASGYSLGNVDGSWQSILIAFPRAVTVTLFQPFLWQANSIVILLSALESTFILGFTIYILYKNGIKRTFSAIINNPHVFFCIFYSVIFAFSVGLTAYNFGALVRYKIPCIPFFLMGLAILNYLTAVERKQLEEQEVSRIPTRRKRQVPVPAVMGRK
jgi:hypothetical protein